jgi:hypothetical protein
VASRILAAAIGGYMLTALAIATLAVYLPLEPAEASLTATMLSFAIYAGIVLWVFATHSAWRVWLCMAAAMAILKVLFWARNGAGLL